MADPHCQPCPPVCPSVFDTVSVSYLIRGGTRVMYTLLDSFLDPGPYVFQLQYGSTANPYADDWVDVGLPVENQYMVIDPEQRMFGKQNTAHYRIQLTTPQDTYYSDPVGAQGVLSGRDWRLARETIRQFRRMFRYGPGGQLGYLLKRRVTGVKCPRCLDLQTGESKDPNCPLCYGTGFQCGYYYPIACVWAILTPTTHRLKSDPVRGQVDDVVVSAIMLAIDMLSKEDIWVNARTDERYFIHSVQNIAEIRGVALVANVELRPAPYTSVIYDIPIPAQLRALETSDDEEH